MYSSQRAGSEEAALECSASTPTLPESPLPGVDLRSLTNPSAPPEHLVNFVRCLEPFLPRGCELFGHDDLKVVGPHPIGGGGFSEAWVCERRDGMVVVIKSYRYYSSSSRLPVFLRLYREALLCGHLNGANDVNFVPFLGIYSSRDHPFALVFKFMSYGSLNEYSRNNQEIGRVKLLLQIARGLEDMHRRGIIHGNIKIENILVDGDGNARIGGLGSVAIHPSTQTADMDQFLRGAALEAADPRLLSVGEPGASKESDISAFGTLAWQVFTGREPRSGRGVVAGMHSISSGRQLAKPSHPELSNRVWELIKGCWKANSEKGKTISDVIAVLGAEANTK